MKTENHQEVMVGSYVSLVSVGPLGEIILCLCFILSLN